MSSKRNLAAHLHAGLRPSTIPCSSNGCWPNSLDEDMPATAVEGIAHVVEDEFSNMYQREN
jgi:hypothetical protein